MADNSPFNAAALANFGSTPAPTPSISETKKANLAATADMKKLALGGNVGAAYVGQTDLANDSQLNQFTDLLPIEQAVAYGPEASEISADLTGQVGDAITTDQRIRDLGQILGDSTLSVGQGAVNAIGGIGAFTAGAVNADAGNAVAEATTNLSQGIGGYKSDVINDKSDIYNRVVELRAGDSDRKYEQDVANGTPLAGLKKLGRDIIDAGSDVMRDPANLTDITAQGIGSLVPTVAAGLATGGSTAAVAATTGLMTAGDAYTQSQQDIMKMSFEDLAKSSQPFNDLVADGYSKDEARIQVANSGGLLSGAVAAPLATAGGKFTAEFAMAPFKVAGATTGKRLQNLGKTILKEGAEEFGQGGLTQLSSNVGIQQYGDADKSIMDGVANAAVTEGLAGLGTAGTLQTPGLLVGAGKTAGQAVAQTASNLAQKATVTPTQRASTALNTAVTKAEAAAPVVEPTVEGETPAVNPVQEAIGNLSRTVRTTPEDLEPLSNELSGIVSEEVLANAPSRVALINAVRDGLFDNGENLSNETALQGIAYLRKNVRMLDSLANDPIPESIAALGVENPIYNAYLESQDAAKSIMNDADINQLLEMKFEPEKVEAVDVTTPEGVKTITEVATADPFAVSQDKYREVLAAVDTGSTQVTPTQKATLTLAAEVVKMSKDALVSKEALEQEFKPNDTTKKRVTTDIVQDEIVDTFNSKNKLPSLKGHIASFMQNMNEGNLPAAQTAYDRMADFADHMQSKLEAANTSYERGDRKPVKYDTLTPFGWLPASDSKANGIYANQLSANSMYTVNNVAVDANTARNMVEALGRQFADQGITPREIKDVTPNFMVPAPQANAPTVSETPVAVLRIEPVTPQPKAEAKPKQQELFPVTDFGRRPKKEKNIRKPLRKITDLGIADLVDLIKNPANMRNIVEAQKASSKPVQQILISLGGIATGTPLYRALKAKDISPSRKGIVPGLFNNKTGLKNLDNIPTSEHEIFMERGYDDGNGYIPSDAWIDAIDAELRGEPWLTNEELDEVSQLEDMLDNLTRDLDSMGIDYENLSTPEIVNAYENYAEPKPLPEQITEPVQMDDLEVIYKIQNGKILLNDSKKRKNTLKEDSTSDSQKTEVTEAPKAEVVETTSEAVKEPVKAKIEPKATVTDILKNTFKIPNLDTSKLFSFDTTKTQLFTPKNVLKTLSAIVKSDGDKGISKRLDTIVPENVRANLAGLTEDYLPMLVDQFNKNLDPKFVERVKADPKLAGATNGRHMLFVDMETGKYLEPISNAMAIAGFEWAMDNTGNGNLEIEDISKLTGIPVGQVPTELMTAMNKGTNSDTAIQNISKRLKDLLGYTFSKNTPMAYGQNLLEVLAAEVLGGLVDTKLKLVSVIKTRVEFTPVSEDMLDSDFTQDYNASTGKVVRDYNTLVPTKFNLEKVATGIKGFKEALSDILVPSKDKTMYINKAPDSVDRVVKKNPSVPLSKKQMSALGVTQNTEYKANTPLIKSMGMLGRDRLSKLLGYVELSEGDRKITHEADAASIDGKNTSIISSLDYLEDFYARMQNPDDVAYFKANISRVGRIHLEGKNPQSNKVVRETISSTGAMLDLTDPTQLRNFWLSVGQSIGVKVHKLSFEESVAKAQKEMDTTYKTAVDEMAKWLKNDASATDASLDLFTNSLASEEITPKHLHAIMAAAQLKNADKKAMKSFPHALALEADGITDGPLNALTHFWAEGFSDDYLKLLEAGGKFLGKTYESVNDYFSTEGNKDTYEITLDRLNNKINTMIQQHPENFQFYNFLASTGNLTQVGENLFESSRNEIKNPLTVYLYGSSQNGINDKIVNSIRDKVYSAITWALKEREKGNAKTVVTDHPMFDGMGNDKVAFFTELFQTTPDAATNISWKMPIQATLPDVVNDLYTQPMFDSISEVMGSVSKTMKQIISASQVQAVVAADQFQKNLESLFVQKFGDKAHNKAGKLNMNLIGRLSPKEYTDLFDSVKEFGARYLTKDQTIDISNKEMSMTDATSAQSNDRRFKSNYHLPVAGNVGVSGAPNVNIASGDAQMMLEIYSTINDAKRTLGVFDGVEIPVDIAENLSQSINEAVFNAWGNNPFDAIEKSFKSFLGIMPKLDTFSDTTLVALYNSTKEPKERKMKILGDDRDNVIKIVRNRLGKLNAGLKQTNRAIAARKQVELTLPSYSDHMAVLAQSHDNAGTVELSSDRPKMIAEMNKLYDTIMTVPLSAVPAPSKALAGALSQGRAIKLDAGTIFAHDTRTLVKALADSKELSNDQMRLLKSLTQATNKDLRIFVGSPKALMQHKLERGSTDTQTINQGQYDPETNSLYLVETSAETLLHEMIHAATFDKLIQYENDKSALSEYDLKAIQNLEGLMEEILDQDLSVESDITNAAISDLYAALDNAPTLAHQLSEFMAWTLANPLLINKMKSVQVKNPLLRAAKEIVRLLKNIFLGRNFQTGSDMLSAVRFNLDILTSSILTTPPDRGGWASLNQTNSATLEKVRRDYSGKMKDLVNSRYAKMMGKGQLNQRLVLASTDSKTEAHRLSQAGFDMNAEQESAYRAMYQVMATDLQLNPVSLAQINKLYDHVIKNLSVESFMDDPNSTNPNDRYEAQNKFNALTGDKQSFRDAMGRSVLLPSFLALSQTNDDMRKAISKIELPKKVNLKWDSVDNAIDSIGSSAMASITFSLSGQKKEPKNVSQALDNLAEALTELDSAASDSIINKMSDFYAGLNSSISGVAQNLAKKGYDKLGDIAVNSSKPVMIGARIAQGAIAPLNRELSRDTSQFITSVMNKASRVPLAVKEFWNEMQGMTLDNESIIRLSKKAKTYVSGLRQDYREVLPKSIKSYFTAPVSKGEWTTMHKTLGQTDLSALLGHMTISEIKGIINSDQDMTNAIRALDLEIQSLDKSNAAFYTIKAKELGSYMSTKTSKSHSILRNADAIARRFGTKNTNPNPDPKLVAAIDQIASLYSLQALPSEERVAMREIMQRDTPAVEFLLKMLKELQSHEQKKVNAGSLAHLNGWKGYIPAEPKSGTAMIVADMNSADELKKRGFTYVSRFHGSGLTNGRYGYFYSTINGGASYQQGALQTVSRTYNGTNILNGRTVGGASALVISDSTSVAGISIGAINVPVIAGEAVQPIFDKTGKVLAYEFVKSPAVDNKQIRNTDLAEMMGAWRGRQIEEAFATGINTQLIQNLKTIYDNQGKTRSDEFVDIAKSKDKIHQETWSLIPAEMKKDIAKVFGQGTFPVRADMINNAIGYRSASVGDLFTGNTRINSPVRETITNIVTNLYGEKAYRYLVQGEKIAQKIVSEAKNIIVIRSIIVPAINIASNVVQLMARGVPLKHMAKDSAAKTVELNQYVANRRRLIDLEAKLVGIRGDLIQTAKVKAEIQSIKDAHRRMSIWPLVEAGEFSTIAEDLSPLDGSLKGGKWIDAIEKAVDGLPKGIRTAGKYAIISRDTALYRILNEATQYGDFIAKAVLYDHLINKKGLDHQEALRQISDEFINYDMLPGRTRSYLDSVGLTWFWNFKIRSVKIALSMLRENPLTALMAVGGVTAIPSFFNIGTPLSDNIFAKINDGGIYRSLGWGMLWDAPTLLPTVDALT